MGLNYIIRDAKTEDLEGILKVYTRSIEGSCGADYSKEQITFWTKSVEDRQKWLNRINRDYFIVAVQNQDIIGFASLCENDYLDLMYLLPAFQSKGIAATLLSRIIKKTSSLGSTKLRTDASITGKSFFEKNGFIQLRENEIKIGNTTLINYEMSLSFGVFRKKKEVTT